MSRNVLAQCALALAAVALPVFVKNDVVLTILVFSFLASILAVSFNLIFGITGQLSMFHAAAFGIGAYATYIAMHDLAVSFWTASALAAAFVVMVSLVIGAICFRFRLKAFYFAVVTLAFAEMARLVVVNWYSVTNGTLGINLSQRPVLAVLGRSITFESTLSWYYLALLALFATILVCGRCVDSWMGRCFAAIRLNDELGDALGINIFRYKLLAFGIGNMLAAFAGALYAYFLGSIQPAYLSVGQSLAIIAMVLLGGQRRVAAPVVGAIFLTLLPHIIDLSAEMRAVVHGAILIFAILLLPKGIVGTVETWVRRRAA